MASAGEEKWQSYSFRNWSRSGWYITQRWVQGGKLMKLVLGARCNRCFPQAVSFEDRTWGTWQLLLHGMRHFAKLRVSETILCYERAFNSAHFVLRVLLCLWTLQTTIIDIIVLIQSTLGLLTLLLITFIPQGYYRFILLSTAIRSFEAGVVASMMPAIRQGTMNGREWRFAPEKAKQCANHFVKGKFKKIIWFVSVVCPKACTSPTPARAMSQVLRIMELFQVASWQWPLGIKKFLYAWVPIIISLALLSSGPFGPYGRCYLKEYVIVAASSMFVFVWHRNIFWRLSSSASRPSLFLATDGCEMIQSRYVKIPSPTPSHGV